MNLSKSKLDNLLKKKKRSSKPFSIEEDLEAGEDEALPLCNRSCERKP